MSLVVRILHSPIEDLQLRATQIFTLFTQDTAMVRQMNKADVVPVFVTIFREEALPARMRLFAVQTLCNLVSTDETVSQIIEETAGMCLYCCFFVWGEREREM